MKPSLRWAVFSILVISLGAGCMPTAATVAPTEIQQEVPYVEPGPLKEQVVEAEIPIEEPAQPPEEQYPAEQYPPDESGILQLDPASLELYLPYQSGAGEQQVRSQVDEFLKQQPNVQVYIIYFNSYTELNEMLSMKFQAGDLNGMIALDYNGLHTYFQNGWLEPAYRSPDFWQQYLPEAIQAVSLPPDPDNYEPLILAYPWQRYSCSPNYLGLAILASKNPYTIGAANALGEYLTNEPNQTSNLNHPDLQWYPTLQSLYHQGYAFCEPTNIIEMPAYLIDAVMASAQEQARKFYDLYKIELNPSMATGLEASEVGGEYGQLASTLVPPVNKEQMFGIHEVIGSISIDDEHISQVIGLPLGYYMVACYPKTRDCVAMDTNGERLVIDLEKITVLEMAAPVQFPNVAYERGSIGGCFHIRRNRYCIWLF